MLLFKGLYGSRMGALSFQVWTEEILVETFGCRKIWSAASVYIKVVRGIRVRLHRHSDDFRLSCQCGVVFRDAEDEMEKSFPLCKSYKIPAFMMNPHSLLGAGY